MSICNFLVAEGSPPQSCPELQNYLETLIVTLQGDLNEHLAMSSGAIRPVVDPVTLLVDAAGIITLDALFTVCAGALPDPALVRWEVPGAPGEWFWYWKDVVWYGQSPTSFTIKNYVETTRGDWTNYLGVASAWTTVGWATTVIVLPADAPIIINFGGPYIEILDGGGGGLPASSGCKWRFKITGAVAGVVGNAYTWSLAPSQNSERTSVLTMNYVTDELTADTYTIELQYYLQAGSVPLEIKNTNHSARSSLSVLALNW